MAALEQMTCSFMPLVEALGMLPQQELHPPGQPCARRLDQEMEVIVHQAERMNMQPFFGHKPPQDREEETPILVIAKYLAAIDSTVHDVVQRSRELDSEWSWHTNNNVRTPEKHEKVSLGV